jgi:hypothetical protein
MTLCETLWMLWIMLWMDAPSSTGIRWAAPSLWDAVDPRCAASWALTRDDGLSSTIHSPYYSLHNSLRESSKRWSGEVPL